MSEWDVQSLSGVPMLSVSTFSDIYFCIIFAWLLSTIHPKIRFLITDRS